ncbi:hypothetical protein N658DRAFT_287091 [Parathielavia hyrcaniae]|uniref:Uncharacterized protein n=1 Tax=Parathielavia hyrcaniae TaxID=113614 RepID=A0AAN6Q6G4_9PEZI|nr:hypothetical protein N658DRAFT_287091 [Parathielavia hyrcaniae]
MEGKGRGPPSTTAAGRGCAKNELHATWKLVDQMLGWSPSSSQPQRGKTCCNRQGRARDKKIWSRFFLVQLVDKGGAAETAKSSRLLDAVPGPLPSSVRRRQPASKRAKKVNELHQRLQSRGVVPCPFLLDYAAGPALRNCSALVRVVWCRVSLSSAVSRSGSVEDLQGQHRRMAPSKANSPRAAPPSLQSPGVKTFRSREWQVVTIPQQARTLAPHPGIEHRVSENIERKKCMEYLMVRKTYPRSNRSSKWLSCY